MVNIDYIMDLLDWNNSAEDQILGIQLAREVKCISAFLQPDAPYGKRVWDNCAKILSERTDEELSYHLISLMEWLQDMNWPGAFCIFDRLQKYEDNHLYNTDLSICIKKAKMLNDEVWENNLLQIKK